MSDWPRPRDGFASPRFAQPATFMRLPYLTSVAGLDVAQTAQVLGKRPGAVRMAAHRGLRRLAESLRGSQRSEVGEHGE